MLHRLQSPNLALEFLSDHRHRSSSVCIKLNLTLCDAQYRLKIKESTEQTLKIRISSKHRRFMNTTDKLSNVTIDD